MPKVLMVDDDVETLSVVEEFLRHAQFETKVCSDPRKALDVFEAFGPDICLLNFNMPYMTGAALMEKIKSIDSTVEVIFMTPENQAVLAIHLMRCGAHDYLLKPVLRPLSLFDLIKNQREHIALFPLMLNNRGFFIHCP